MNVLESVVNVLSEESEVGLQECNCIGDDLDFVVALLAALRVVDILLVTVGESLVVLSLLLVAADLSVVLLSLGSVDALGEGVNFAVELLNLGSELGNLVRQLGAGRGVLLNPVLIITAFDLAGLGNLRQEGVAEINNSLNEALVSLHRGGGGDLSEQVEDLVPRLALEGSLGVLGEVGGDLSHNFDVFLLQEGVGLQGLDNDLLGTLDDVLGLVVLGLFLSPFSVLDFLVGIDFADALLEDSTEDNLLVADACFLVSNGDLLSEFGIEFGNAGIGSLNLSLKLGELSVALFLELEDELVILVLLVLEFVLSFLKHADQILNRATSSELQLDRVKQGLSVLGDFHLVDGAVDFLVSNGARAECEDCN